MSIIVIIIFSLEISKLRDKIIRIKQSRVFRKVHLQKKQNRDEYIENLQGIMILENFARTERNNLDFNLDFLKCRRVSSTNKIKICFIENSQILKSERK